MLHELGHRQSLQLEVGLLKSKRWESSFKEIQDSYIKGDYFTAEKFRYPFESREMGFFTYEGRANIHITKWETECFAQAYSNYVMDAGAMKRALPKTYRFFKEVVFNGTEYFL